MSKLRNKIIGNKGEQIAKEYLEKTGYEIIEQNWRYSRFCEIDIIAKDKSTLVFCEVKTRSSVDFGHPFEAVDNKKLEKIHTAIMAYLQQNEAKFKDYRIDVISVIGLKEPEIEHLKNVSLN